MTTNIHADKILIIDFGSQYCQLIARRVRENGVYCEIYPFDIDINAVNDFKPKGIILSGGPETVTTNLAPKVTDDIFALGIPILGICYGMQTITAQLGGKVGSSQKREFGLAEVANLQNCTLLKGIEDRINNNNALLDVWMSHGDKVVELPEGFVLSATTDSAPIAAMFHPTKQIYGLQFHPEVTHTNQGKRIIDRFVSEICQCHSEWTTKNIIHDAITSLRQTIGEDNVLLGLSGGVDSSVVAALLHEAIGDQLICVFVDNGLLRLNEAQQVMQTFADNMGIRVIHVDASAQFLDALQNITDPEEKRKIIGGIFIDVFNEEAKKLTNITWFAQGTIYPDVVESAATKYGKAHVIKSHHNVGGLPDDLPFKLLEPLRELFKDEVRAMGLELGLPYDMVYRHPFPGPGLGVRILGEVKAQYADLLRQADAILLEELHNAELYHKTSQAFAVFLPVKSVGVMGDTRKYDYVIAIRVVETIDFMTAKCSEIPYEILFKISNRIINEVNGIARVTYDITSKPPATIEWE